MKSRTIAYIGIAAVLIVTIFLFEGNKNNNFKGIFIEKNENYSIEKIIFNSKDSREIYSLLFFPDIGERVPVVIVLPGAGGTKESRKGYADIFYKLGYATLILDQRGIGETSSSINSFEQDYQDFLIGEKTTQELMADDVIYAIKAAKKINRIDNRKIGILGESMGGRYAIIAAALDKDIKTAVIISSSGYNFVSQNPDANRFISLINPNVYISQISPRRLLMLHSVSDNVIKIDEAKVTFKIAKEPKKFVEINDSKCVHGYCDEMYAYIKSELEEAFR